MAGFLRRVAPLVKNVRFGSSAVTPAYVNQVAGREIVGYGMNGETSYIDRADFPLPAIRFGKETASVKELREKEKGDWKKLTIAEKKALYRHSFCQTLVEVDAPTGEWKSVLGFSLMLISSALWVFMLLKTFAYNPELPPTFTEERQAAQLRRILDLKMNPIEGISSKWDYENNKWK